MIFSTKYDRPMSVGEVNSGELIVETAGYVSAQKQIEGMLYAGQRLDAFRRGEYEFGPDEPVPDDYYGDPTRMVGFDPADAQELAEALSAKAGVQKSDTDESTAEAQPDASDKDSSVEAG